MQIKKKKDYVFVKKHPQCLKKNFADVDLMKSYSNYRTTIFFAAA